MNEFQSWAHLGPNPPTSMQVLRPVTHSLCTKAPSENGAT